MNEHDEQPYENLALKREAQAIIARQRRGEILVTHGPSETWFLPHILEVEGAKRSRNGYTSPWGTFSLVYDLRMYVFHPDDGKVPPVWQERDLRAPLELASVLVDPARRWARVISDDDGQEIALLADAPVWLRNYQLLSHVQQTLVSSRIPAVAWRIERQELEAGQRAPLWDDGRSPLVRNEHAAVNLAGYAFDQDHNLVYLSAVGHKTALEAIRASLLGRQRQGKLQFGASAGHTRLNGLDRYEQVWTPLADFAAHHVVFLARQALQPEPADSVTYLLVFDSADSGDELLATQAAGLLAGRLHAALPIPILGEWADALWQAALERKWIERINAGGDCRACWSVSLMTDWSALVDDLLVKGDIEIEIES